MAPIYLVRHGEAAASWGESSDPGLSTLGHRQAAKACANLEQALEGVAPSVLSSPLLRARETAAPLFESSLVQRSGRSTQLSIDPRFREIPSPVPLSERQPWLRGFMREQWSQQSADLLRWRQDMLDALAELDSSVPNVIFTHFLVINTLVGSLTRNNETLVFWPDNASITTIGRSESGLVLESLGRQMQTVVN